MIDILEPLIKQFMPFAQKQMGFDRVPRLFLKNDDNEANNPMGKTGFYDPNDEAITIYIGKRHPKDIMRSLAHELMHHTQKCNGEFDNMENMGEEGYAQNNTHLRSMEIRAYQASIVFRDWEDSTKGTIYYEHLQKGDKKMSLKDWKNKELTTILSEAWGFKFNTLDEFNEFNGEGELQAEDADAEVQEKVSVDTETVNEEEEAGNEYADARKKCAKSGKHWDDKRPKGQECVSAEKEEVNEEEDIEEASTPARNAQGRDTAGRRIRKEQLDAVVKKAIKEALQKRKG